MVWGGGGGDYIKRYAIIILRQKTKEASMSLFRLNSHRHVKSIQSICEADRDNLLQSSKSFSAGKRRGGGEGLIQTHICNRYLNWGQQITAEFRTTPMWIADIANVKPDVCGSCSCLPKCDVILSETGAWGSVVVKALRC